MKKSARVRGTAFMLAAMLLVIWLSMDSSAAQLADVNDSAMAAQEPETGDGQDITDEASRESNIEAVLATNPEDAGEPNRTVPVHGDSAYTSDVFFGRTTLHGIFSSAELFFYIPDYWETDYVYVELEYSVSQLIRSLASSMTFSVNNVPVSSCRVAYEGGNTQVAYVEIPMELVNEGYNSFTVSAYARLYDEQGCIDDFTNANWLSLSENSYIRCGYGIKDAGHRIAYYPYPFMSTTDKTGKGLTIAVSDQAADREVAAAMNLMADLSTETSGSNAIHFALLSDIPSTGAERTVLVSLYDNLPAPYQQKITDTAGLEEQAAVLFTDDGNGNPLLLLTSRDEECLVEASYMLMDDDRVSQEKDSLAWVKKGSADAAVNSTALSQMVAGNYTVGDIAGSGLTFVGPFHQEQLLYLPFSEDYFLSDAGKVTLSFRYSENLDFDRSLVSVYWGNVPVASKKLEKEKSEGDELTFAMPADVVGTTTGAIRIAFDMEIKDMICTPRSEQMPWAYVSDESILYLPASTGIVLTFDLKPSPFRTDGKFNDMMLVIPDNPTSRELDLYAQVIGMYGDGVDPYGNLFVKRESEFSVKDADYNIIAIGNYTESSLLRKLNDSLHFAYAEDGSSFESNEQLILSDRYAGNIAILQLLESPFAKNRGILAITDTGSGSLDAVETFMRDEKLRFSLTKDCVIIDKDLDTKSYQFIDTMSEIKEPTLFGSLTQNRQSILFTIVATSVMLMLLIAVIIILIRIRMYNRKKGE